MNYPLDPGRRSLKRSPVLVFLVGVSLGLLLSASGWLSLQFSSTSGWLHSKVDLWPQELTITASTSHDMTVSPLQTLLYAGDLATLKALNLELHSGQFFTRQHTQVQESVVLISESLAKQILPDGLVLGKLLYLQGETKPVRIIGVVHDRVQPDQSNSNVVYRVLASKALPLLLMQRPMDTPLSPELPEAILAQFNPAANIVSKSESTTHPILWINHKQHHKIRRLPC